MEYKLEVKFEFHKSMVILDITILVATFLGIITLKDYFGSQVIFTWSLILLIFLILIIIESITLIDIKNQLEKKLK
ncbi:MAG: hypothetical protein KC550_07685 [Nanoarchaeota archaeon]|nr:hypothetical protein [Nanoarchaeota archaeon]